MRPSRARAATAHDVGAVDQQAVAKRHPAEAQALAPRGGPGQPWARREAPLPESLIRAPPGEVGVEARGELDVGDRGALVGAVDERRRLEQRQLALRAEAVDGGRAERLAEPVAVAEARHHDRDQGRLRVELGEPCARSRRRAGESAGELLPTTALGELELESVADRAEQRLEPLARLGLAARPGGTRQSTRTSAQRRDHVLLRGRAGLCRHHRHPQHRLGDDRRSSCGGERAQPLDRGLELAAVGAVELLAEQRSRGRPRPRASAPAAAARAAAPAPGASFSSALSPSAGTRGVPGDAAGAQQEAVDALLADAEGVEAPAVELERGARRPR